jgi:hypothetical protein
MAGCGANERLVDQRQHPIAERWGKGNKASADMMSLDASRRWATDLQHLKTGLARIAGSRSLEQTRGSAAEQASLHASRRLEASIYRASLTLA